MNAETYNDRMSFTREKAVLIRRYEEADELAVVSLWNKVLPDSAPHNDPATSIRKKLAVQRDLFFVATILSWAR
jgi:hypothetical protein